jgi:hypothetical protein
LQNQAFSSLLEVTDTPVAWAYEVWDELLVDGLESRYRECTIEKNCTLIRYDILQSLRNVYDQVKDEAIKAKALDLIASEEDLKYRKKYATLWKQAVRT